MSNNKEVYNGRAKTLSKLFRYLFLLSIGTALSSMMIGDIFAQFIPNLYLPGVILDVACAFGYSVFLLRLAPADKQYRTAGYCMLIAGAIRLMATDISANASKFVFLITIATTFVQFIGEYNEMTAHDTLMIETDFKLSERWTLLRKCYMIAFLTNSVSLMLTMLIPSVGAVIYIAASVALAAISVFKTYFLYRTWKAFEAL